MKQSGAGTVAKSKLGAAPRLVRRIEEGLGKSYNHYRPARHLLEKQTALLPKVDEPTLERFEKLFGEVNKRLS